MTQNIKEIRPNPLVSTAVEIRFKSELQNDEVLPRFLSIYGSEFPKLKINELPRNLRITPALEYLSDFTLSNSDYSISASNKAIAFENVGEYKLWPRYFHQIKESLEKLHSNNIVTSIIRVGLRYISIIDTDDPIDSCLNLQFNVGYEGFTQTTEYFRSVFRKNELGMILQIANNATAKSPELTRKGLYLDIDSFQDTELPKNISGELYKVIDTLHSAEKSLFEYLITDNSLKKYEIKN